MDLPHVKVYVMVTTGTLSRYPSETCEVIESQVAQTA